MSHPIVTRSPGQIRGSIVASAALGLALAIAAAVLLLVPVPRALHEQRAFAAAAECPANSGSGDCLRRMPATVTGTDSEYVHKTTVHWLSLTERNGTAHRLAMRNTGPVYSSVSPGDRVTVTYWRGRIRSVGFHGWRQATAENPAGRYRTWSAAGLGLPGLAGVFLWCAHALRRAWHSPDPAVRRGRRMYVPVTAALVIGGIGCIAPFVTSNLSAALQLTALCDALVLVVTAAVMFLLGRRTSDSLAVTPRTPEREERFPGLVIGQVPYAGGGFLVAAPGQLAVTIDPDGRILRKPLPRTLLVERVRHLYLTDPVDAPQRGSRVIECRDGEQQVLIVTGKKNVPWVLGALAPEAVRTAAE
ncbi:hypothetical protein [Streptomyces orinoci]|uniref:DUF3592 domain-containing protein n=1 Tax=Streptomyces orinoci TaxID=67339 RepID=A0ABV3JVB5_STRON|nr:hypothetical protein [Streptomyces orinoci]